MTARDEEEHSPIVSRVADQLADPETIAEAETVIAEIPLDDVTVTKNGDTPPEE